MGRRISSFKTYRLSFRIRISFGKILASLERFFDSASDCFRRDFDHGGFSLKKNIKFGAESKGDFGFLMVNLAKFLSVNYIVNQND